MAIVYHIDRDEGISFTLWDQTVGADEYLAHVRRLVADPDWPPNGNRHLSDLRTSTLDVSIDEAVLKTTAGLFGGHPHISNLRAAFVANEAFRKAAMFERFIREYGTAMVVFNSLDTACTWLDIDPARAAAVMQSLRDLSRGAANPARGE